MTCRTRPPRFWFLLPLAALTLTACQGWPGADAARNTPYPVLLPLEQVLAETTTPPDPAPALNARAAALRARAATLRAATP
ncbi:hypothetical protein CCR83_06905 [Rhodobacter veldkampii DSM 11550]|uniref:Uncharacterized protein n=1 Tax=Phaeovulum veldkampii DSM 11550 TaxID=1185920 RepID=A0A2T4JHI5_9RHOB|nr:hypothetical protein [Phaeovulum veldkampii]MBK5946185.1 hypothetical protein [Phaeovulum veldkampii DSM 11550]NCU21228.1 hypothetical protein [Candidatus Falkowbacteria bacterium]PTE17356.1 hypothetical protein C5F46_09560 [Phaeovulum veldkampii DSM 11550]TDQ56578.1 hypothetical protein EV658_11745 [Phaeovulum veldkampii DSM 11550]